MQEPEDEKLELVDLEKLKQHPTYGELFSLLIDAGVVNKQGIRISGMGMLNKKMRRMMELQDKTNLNLFHMEKKLER